MPREYDPASIDSRDHAHWMARAWAGCLLELHRIFEIKWPFSVGFILSHEIVRPRPSTATTGRLYFVNPLVIGPRTHRRRFTRGEADELIADDAHEFVHGGVRARLPQRGLRRRAHRA